MPVTLSLYKHLHLQKDPSSKRPEEIANFLADPASSTSLSVSVISPTTTSDPSQGPVSTVDLEDVVPSLSV